MIKSSKRFNAAKLSRADSVLRIRDRFGRWGSIGNEGKCRV